MPSPDLSQPAPQPIDTSIVLATCSRATLLQGALASLLAQDWIQGWIQDRMQDWIQDRTGSHAVEFILVDDGSTDDTPAILRDFQRQAGVPVTLLQGAGAGIAAARNLGFHAARGEWIASFDDDQIASPGWLRALRERADASGAACVGGALTLLLPGGVALADFGPRTRGVLGEHLLGAEARPYRGGNELPATNNALLRRAVLDSTGAFDPRFTEGGEDKDLFRRVQAAGGALWFEPAAHAGHITPPERLAETNLRWTSLRLGASDARVRLFAGGALAAFRLAALRAAVSLLRDLPSLLWITIWAKFWAKLRPAASDTERNRLEARCSLWYTEGLLRALPELLSPDHSRQLFLRSLDFRRRNGERAERTRSQARL